MKVILSVQSVRYPLTGIGRYTYELARNLPNLPGVGDLKYFDENSFVDNLESRIVDSGEAEVVESLFRNLKRQIAKNKPILDFYLFLKKNFEKDKLGDYASYLYHGTNFYLPKFSGATVVTMHDLSVLTMPENHPRERVLYLGTEMESAAQRATKIVTDSHYIRSEILSYFGFPQDKVHVAELACGDEFHPRTEAELRPTLDAYGLKAGHYSLYAGTIEPRKNLVTLIDAYSRLPQTLRERFPLVLAGYKGWNNAKILNRIQSGTREGWIKHLGYVPDGHLPLLFSGARLFTFPSLYEGFGLPVLEAMASGVPVIASNRASLPEVGGDAVAYTEADDVERITTLCEQVLSDDAWHRDLSNKGLLQARKFSWKRCAEDTMAVYRAAISN